ncbi:hypothetical protein FSARC_11224 [Fusarium sarcochroum]|uniref:Uncharacterized protein n=1 Tax=Fusarium sarcochroum TaxID=1208366 RepID=A0A8H4TGY4_9HYPO|nr:hypothetical protein FSARC_11224 [Fusarium sarcochroum]
MSDPRGEATMSEREEINRIPDDQLREYALKVLRERNEARKLLDEIREIVSDSISGLKLAWTRNASPFGTRVLILRLVGGLCKSFGISGPSDAMYADAANEVTNELLWEPEANYGPGSE